MATAATASYRIALVNNAGDTIRTIEKFHRPIPISDAQWANATARLTAARARPGYACDRSRFDRPRQLPAIQDMYYDADARLWVETWTAAGRVVDIFDHAGTHIATANTLEHLGSFRPYIRGDRAYTITQDSLGVYAVKVFAIERGGPGRLGVPPDQ
jgi:hypothetical protein